MQSNGLDMQRFCPECGHVGEVGAEHRSCCPDGSSAFMVPAKWANELRAGFKARLAAVQQGVQPPFMYAIADGYGQPFFEEEGCVSSEAKDLQPEVDSLNQNLDGEPPYKVVALYTHPTQQGLDLRQLQEIKRAVDDFANFSETDIDYELLLRAAQARYLECTHFAVWNKAALERDLAAAQAKQGGV